MKKSYYFPHDYNARNDAKMLKLRRIHGPAGKGIYWDLIESLYEEEGKLDWAAAEEVAFFNQVDYQIVCSVIKDFGLFDYDATGFWSPSQVKRQGHIEEISEKRRQAANYRRRSNSLALNNNTSFEQKESKSNANDEQLLPKIKENKRNKENKEDSILTLTGEPVRAPKLATINLSKDECEQIATLWNEEITQSGATFSKVASLSEDRCNRIRIRWKEFARLGPPQDIIKEIFSRACKSTFLQGGVGGSSWKASFDWIFTNGKNWLKIYEGNYDDAVQSRGIAGRGSINVGDDNPDKYEGKF